MAVSLTISSNLAMPLSQENLPRTVTLTAAGVDSNDGSATFNYSWHIIDKPTGSATVLSALVGTNVQLDIDTWGTYRVFCIATNLGTNESSEDNPYAAPLDAFFNVQVESTKYDLEKPAKSQRNWHPQYWHLVDTVENLRFDPATFIEGGSVEIATAREIAQQAGRTDSSSGEHYLAVTTEELYAALHPTVNGNLGSGGINVLRNRVKDIALEKINESSITELKDVDTTTQAPTPGQVLIWSPTHTDDTNGDTGAWIPGDAGSGGNNPFGIGLCAGEALNTGDFLIYQEDCNEVPVAGPVPGWHARNRSSGEGFALNFPLASPGRATSQWHAVAEAAGAGTWADNEEALGLVQIASAYNTAKANLYNHLVYTNAGEIQSAQNLGTLKSFAMSPYHFLFSLGTATFSSIPGLVDDIDKDGERIVMYDVGFHTTSEITALAADATDPSGTFDRAEQNVMALGLTNFFVQRMSRSSITRLADVDTTTHVPANGDLLYWDAGHTDDSGLEQTGAWVPKSLAEIGISGGGVDGLTSNSSDTITIDSGYNIIPATDNAQVLGADDAKFQRIYVNELTGDSGSTDGLDTRLSLNAEIPGSAATGLRAAALYSRGSIAMMIDTNNTGNADTNSFYVYEGAEDDSSATERFRVENDGTVRINDAYNMPLSDGSPNQILQTNGSGQLSFVNNTSSSSTYKTHYEQTHLGPFDAEITYNNSGYTVGVGESPLLFMFRNFSGGTLKLKEFTFTCGEMYSSTLKFSFVGFTHNQLLNNQYATISSEYTLTRTNTDAGTNNQGIGSLEQDLGDVSLSDGEYFGVFIHSSEKTGHDNKRFFINVQAEE